MARLSPSLSEEPLDTIKETTGTIDTDLAAYMYSFNTDINYKPEYSATHILSKQANRQNIQGVIAKFLLIAHNVFTVVPIHVKLHYYTDKLWSISHPLKIEIL